MKKALILLVPALALLASCGDAIEIPDVSGSGNVPVIDPDVPLSGDVVFTGTIEDLPDGSQAVWAQGESILLSDGASVQTLTNRAAAGQVAEFPGKVTEGKTAFVAVYPAADGVSIDGTTVSFEIPTAQTAAGPAYKVAKASGTQLYFRSLVSVVNFSVGYEGVTKVRFQATGGNIAGAVTADYAGETPTVSATADFVEVTGAFQPGETYSFSALPGTYEGITIVAYSGDKATAHVSVGEVDLKKGLSVDLSALQQDIPTYRITNMWVCGGTGPDYGGCGVIDILTKTNYWNTEDGRGITALKDNYYQLRPDGTFVNYAGEDGRNWWFVYSGSVNPQNGQDLDLRKFYDVLPLSTGSYAIDGATVTFTKADGSTTQATLVGPGTYDMPDTNPVKSVTIESQALMFTITGGVESWDSNIMYTDYHAIAGNPKALFIEMEVLPNGFVVPEASKTTDADFKYEPPSFDWTSLPGKWNVYGNNSTKDGLWVLGGSGSDPAFVSPIDKTWDWDGTIYKESDNELIIKVTGFTGTGATGTTNWWAGADGGFWDYIFKSTSYPDYDGTDLSRYYDQIPKGEKEFSVDIATQTVTLGNGHQAKFLTPGTHKFVNNKTLVIPTDCFGLQFHLNDYPVEKTAYQYKDIDRFLFAPLEYIIIFEKTE